MTGWLSAALSVAALVVVLAAIHVPFGDFMARTFTSPKHTRIERTAYRIVGVDADADQRWPVYLRSLLIFSTLSVLVLYAMLRLQPILPLANGKQAMPPLQSMNTAISFVTNTNWQSYSGESLGFFVQMAGLAVQNFWSAAVGLSVVVALIRGFARCKTDRVGNFWVDLSRAVFRILLPIAFVLAVVLMLSGVIQNFSDTTVTTLSGGDQLIPGGPVASQEAIKQLGTNGGGFFNANSAHPFENPTPVTNLLAILMLLAIPFSLPRTFGQMVGQRRQGAAILATMMVLWGISVALTVAAENAHGGVALQAAGAATEGKELRFGVPMSAVFGASTTLTSTGAVNSMHDSYTPFGGGMTILNMGLGEVAPGGVGSGLYGMLILAIVTVFIAGLMVGRTPEYLGKKLGAREIKLASLYILVTPTLALAGTGIAMATQAGRSSMLNPGPHGLSEVLYAFTSASNNNGSAFAGLSANTDFYNIALAMCMFLGRFVPMIFVLALAGSLAGQARVPETSGTLPTHKPQFVGLLAVVTVALAGLVYFPALALGPIAEALS